MSSLRAWLQRVVGLFGKPQRDADFAAELDSHIQLHIENCLRKGMSSEAARRDALLKLGGLEQTKESHRDQRSLPLLETMFQDLRFTARMLRKNPGFAAAAIFTLALGFGVNTAVFCWTQTIVMTPIPGVADPARLLTVMQADRGNVLTSRMSYPDFRELEGLHDVFEGVLGTSPASVVLSWNGQNEWVSARVASASSFTVLGVHAKLGRTFLPGEDQGEGAHPVILISHGLWQNQFGSDPAILGTVVRLNQQPFTIVGVTPPEFQGVSSGSQVDVWAPLSMHNEVLDYGSYHSRSFRWIQSMARLRPGVSLSTAQAAVAALSARLESAYPDTNQNIQFKVFPLWRSPLGGQALFLPVLRLLAAVGVGLLLVVAGNVSCLLLARATGRQKEVAVRLAIGASRARLIRQLLTESLVMAMAGGCLGALFARYAVNLFFRFAPQDVIPYQFHFVLGWSALAFTFLLVLLSVLLFGLAPALWSSCEDANSALHEARRGASIGGREHRLLKSLIVCEVAISIVLLIGAGLCAKGFWRASHMDLGFHADNVLYAGLNLVPNGYSPQQAKNFDHELCLRLAALPGAVDAALVNTPPLGPNGLFTGRVDVGGVDARASESHLVPFLIVSPGYFSVLRIPIVRGREFTFQDDSSRSHVAIINETMARRYWLGLDPVGHEFQMAVGVAPSDTFTVIGVVPDTKSESLNEPAAPLVYVTYIQRPLASLYMSVLLRTKENPQLMSASLRRAIHALDPNIEPLGVLPLRHYMEHAFLPVRIAGISLAVLGATALFLTSLGLYGVMAYAVSRRTHEIGIRRALGLQAHHAVQMVLREGMFLVGIGAGLGLAAALALTRTLASFLFGVSATDSVTFLAAALILTVVAFAACYVPARRAARIDPMIALRYE